MELSAYTLSQILIGIAFCFDLASFQFRKKKRVLLCLGIACLLISAHFWLLGLQTAGLISAIATVRFFTAIFTSSSRLLWLFWTLILVSALVTYSGLLTVLVTTSAMLSTWGAFRARDQRFRQVMMVASLFMITHNVLAGSPAAVALEVFFLGSNLVAYYRYYLRHLRETS